MVNMTEKRQRSMNIKSADEENTSFGLPAKMLDRKSGFESKVATQEVNMDKDRVFSPHTKKEVPRESLAVRLDKSRKEVY
jgi:hypothetical protein